jgi:hypothetical protein
MGTGREGARPPSAPTVWGTLLLCVALGTLPSRVAAAWKRAHVEPVVDTLGALLQTCQRSREAALQRNDQIDAWLAYTSEPGAAATAQAARVPVPDCSASGIAAALGAGRPAVWAIASGPEDGLLFATANLPVPGILVSTDGGESWRWRHVFLRGYNVERGLLVRGLDYRHGLLAVASDLGVLLSTDRGLTFTSALDHLAFTAVVLSPHQRDHLVAAGDGTSFLSTDGGSSWIDLDFTGFVGGLATQNPHVTDHVISLQLDPDNGRTVYAGTGSHLYRLVLDGPAGHRWQAMEGRGGPAARVDNDSTVYNIAIGRRFMISTCNGVYVLQRLSPALDGDQAEVTWGKFRDGKFANRQVGGPKGNLRSYFVAEDPSDPSRILVADFAGFYEGRSELGRVRWRRVEGLPFYTPDEGYPEYTAIAWASDGRPVVGSRYQGIFVHRSGPRRPPKVAAQGSSGAWAREVPRAAVAREWAPAPPAHWSGPVETHCRGVGP